MMTWAITKLSRTAELTILITIGYLLFGFIPLSLNAMVLVAILNDLVTMVIGTDNAQITYHPEKWNILKLGKIAAGYIFAWIIVGIVYLITLKNTNITSDVISTNLFIYLMFSAMATILLSRNVQSTKIRPSKMVKVAITGNCLLTIILSLGGIGITRAPAILCVIDVAIVLLVTAVLFIVQKMKIAPKAV
ncbi:E1-E2 family cation-transport ATPase [Paucilactobacillus suebicus DSM 5007 = KCTC 3549]|uniref:E1-E2 family cation-transport ATPase n=1 Tax=Paucilactobacillus suebicus DSM 5007 = KCTC 3549 TaxID=1423807 RepID=A0A0R1W2R0_9LACO|nr:E1-E2 family cation-transport ATPase [Paucilactobacillus suebicus DSM 5007 = KCTC 3549]